MKKISATLLVVILGLATQGLGKEADQSKSKEAHHGKSADEIAKELANPNNSLASLAFKNQYTWYTGDLPGADDQDNYTLLFQPIFPFPLAPTASGGKPNIFVRPAFPILFDQPVPVATNGQLDWDGISALGDIGFDLAYGVTEKNGIMWALGMVGTLPTATDSEVAGKQLRLGPEALIAKFEKWGTYGFFPGHQWDVSGWDDDIDYSTTRLEAWIRFLPGGGWNIGTEPVVTYDWESEDWTIPLNLSVKKTVAMGSTPVQFELEVNYYVEQPDEFGPEWMVGFNITPVVPNFINNWIRRN